MFAQEILSRVKQKPAAGPLRLPDLRLREPTCVRPDLTSAGLVADVADEKRSRTCQPSGV